MVRERYVIIISKIYIASFYGSSCAKESATCRLLNAYDESAHPLTHGCSQTLEAAVDASVDDARAFEKQNGELRRQLDNITKDIKGTQVRVKP